MLLFFLYVFVAKYKNSMQHSTIIETPRLILKATNPSFIPEIYNTKSIEEIISYFGFEEANYNYLLDMHRGD